MKKIITAAALALAVLSAVPLCASADELTAEVTGYTKTSVSLSWNDTGADVYELYTKTDEGDFEKICDVTGTSFTADGLEPGTEYEFRICSGDEHTDISAASAPRRVLNLKEQNVFTSAALVKWTLTGRCSGFEIRYSRKSDFDEYEQCESTGKSIRIKGLKRDTLYYVKVRAYTESGGKRYYGSWSQVTSFRYHEFAKKKGITYADGHMIVNKTYSLPAGYSPGLSSTAKKAFSQMKKDAAGKGVTLYISSGYRSYSTQKYLYGSYRNMYGTKVADIFSARAGHSEHQSGLAMDLNIIKDSFAGTKEAKWIDRNCWKYGFVIRYPEGKSDVTGYKYEPWHVRYVGKTLAKKLYNGGNWITIEEYYGLTSRY